MNDTPAPPPPADEQPESTKDAKARAKADKAYQKASRPWYKKKRFILPGGLLVLVVLIVALSGGGDEADPTAADPTTQATDTATSEPTASATAGGDPAPTDAPEATATDGDTDADATTVGIGEAAKDGKFEFVVEAFECGVSSVGPELLEETAQGQFCLLELTVTNTGDEAQFMFADDQYLHDDQEREFSANSMASLMANEDSDSMFAEEINPGNTISGTVVFDIPEDVTIVDVELHDSAFSGGVVVPLN